MVPDFVEVRRRDTREIEAGQRLGGVARQHLSGRRHVQETPAPAAHARFRPLGVIVGQHIVDNHDSGEQGAGGFDDCGRGVELIPARQQCRPIAQGPAVILNMRYLQPVGAEAHCHLDNCGETFEILPMHDGIDGQRQPGLADQFGCPMLFRLRSGKPGDAVAGGDIGVLETKLHVLEDGFNQLCQATGFEPDP